MMKLSEIKRMTEEAIDDKLNRDSEFYDMCYGEEAIYDVNGFYDQVIVTIEDEEGHDPDDYGNYPTLSRMDAEGIISDIVN